MSQINVNNIVGKNGASAVSFPHGITVTGVVTATQLNQNVTGNITASGTVTGGAFSGPLTGNVTGNCSGTAGSLAAGATGADLTLSGDLTVNGTTTTIDTAVTAVDSLAVDGQVTAGSIGIGTDNLNSVLPLTIAGQYPGIQFKDTQGTTDFNLNADDNSFKIQTGVAGSGPVEKFRIDQHGTTKFKGPLTEKCHYDTGGGLNGDYNHDLITYGNVYWSDTAAAGAFTFNLRGSATVALNDMMDTGESLSFWLAHACHSTTSRYMTAFKVDGTTISGGNIIWAGGSAPSAAGGGSGTKDVYTFTVFKVGNNSFRAFAAQTNHT